MEKRGKRWKKGVGGKNRHPGIIKKPLGRAGEERGANCYSDTEMTLRESSPILTMLIN